SGERGADRRAGGHSAHCRDGAPRAPRGAGLASGCTRRYLPPRRNRVVSRSDMTEAQAVTLPPVDTWRHLGSTPEHEPVEVMLHPKVWSQEWKVVEAREAGPVQKGDVLVKFDEEKIAEAIDTAERDLAIAKLALAARVEEVARAETASKQALERAENEKSV